MHFNKRVTELIGSKKKIKILKNLILILNLEFNLIEVLLYPYVKLLNKVILSKLGLNLEF